MKPTTCDKYPFVVLARTGGKTTNIRKYDEIIRKESAKPQGGIAYQKWIGVPVAMERYLTFCISHEGTPYSLSLRVPSSVLMGFQGNRIKS